MAPPIEELVTTLLQAIEATESHLLGLGFNARRLQATTGFARIEAIYRKLQEKRDTADATEVLKARFFGVRSDRELS